jgi:hypothetical protein
MATPSTMAMAVSAVRSLRPPRPLTAKRITRGSALPWRAGSRAGSTAGGR